MKTYHVTLLRDSVIQIEADTPNDAHRLARAAAAEHGAKLLSIIAADHDGAPCAACRAAADARVIELAAKHRATA